jgi:hypothetical protein
MSDTSDEGNTMDGTSSSDRDVYFEPAHYTPGDIEAVLWDGTRLKAEYQLDGQRLGFERPLPVGTLILLRGVRGWVVGSSDPHTDEPGD